ncbi:hypothetical protein A0H81_09166 [Grifola frondosa]|uniref:Uncharacterized protein n=1 Tax=Grifola frondosa TaxID=5627 RepID=A0A1C7M190_GRIFR|nr:hypothetical protein A0H81_09166 [Grifola frondosa]
MLCGAESRSCGPSSACLMDVGGYAAHWSRTGYYRLAYNSLYNIVTPSRYRWSHSTKVLTSRSESALISTPCSKRALAPSNLSTFAKNQRHHVNFYTSEAEEILFREVIMAHAKLQLEVDGGDELEQAVGQHYNPGSPSRCLSTAGVASLTNRSGYARLLGGGLDG